VERLAVTDKPRIPETFAEKKEKSELFEVDRKWCLEMDQRMLVSLS
jgi:hypothetical protein